VTDLGTLYGVGVGPGDPELLTRKAERVIRATPIIAVPVASSGGESYALDIVRDLLQPEQKVIELHFPMVRDLAVRDQHRRNAAEAITTFLKAGQNVAFLTEGDPLLHSTFGYVLHYLTPGLPVDVVPGVSSILAASADLHLPLVEADQRLAILPATFESIEDLPSVFHDFDTVVLLKINRVLDQVLDVLEKNGLSNNAVLVERASHRDGRVVPDVRLLRGASVHYLSLLIVYSRRRSREG